MISLDSPIAAVLGDKQQKRKRIVEGLGLRTVGDLLHHFPRRYLETGELTGVAELQEGQLLTVVGEIVQLERQHLHGPAHRPPGLPARGRAARPTARRCG